MLQFIFYCLNISDYVIQLKLYNLSFSFLYTLFLLRFYIHDKIFNILFIFVPSFNFHTFYSG